MAILGSILTIVAFALLCVILFKDIENEVDRRNFEIATLFCFLMGVTCFLIEEMLL